MPGVNGLKATSVYYDEASTINVEKLLAMKYAMQQRLGRPDVKPIEVPCLFCGAIAGQPCKSIRQHVNWFNGHVERANSARAVTEARNALL